MENVGGWLTTVVGRICLDILCARATKPELTTEEPPEPTVVPLPVAPSPDEALLNDSLGLALLVVLDTLTPAERLAFVLHDMFGVPFDEIAPIVDRTSTAARKLVSRARRRAQSDPTVPDRSAANQREVVTAFLTAARDGDFAALLRLLEPDVVLWVDPSAVEMAGRRADAGAPLLEDETRGADAVTRVFAGRAAAARVAMVEGSAGAVWAPEGRPVVALSFVARGGRVAAIGLLADPETLAELDLEL